MTDSIELAVPALQRSLIGALAAAFLLARAGPDLSHPYLGEPALVPLLLLFAASLPIRPFVAFGLAALQSKGHFAALAAALLAGAAVQAAVSLALAAGGAGSGVSGVGSDWAGRSPRSDRCYSSLAGLHGRRAQATVREHPIAGQSLSRPMLGEIGAGGSSRIDYPVLGLFASTSVVGVYYFAFQLVAKGASVIGLVARTVMYPNSLAELARRSQSAATFR